MVLSSLDKLSLRPSGEKASIPRGRAASSPPVCIVRFRMKSHYLTFQTALSMQRLWLVWRLVILRSIEHSSMSMIRRSRSSAFATLLGEKRLAFSNFANVLCAEYPGLLRTGLLGLSRILAIPEEPSSNHFFE